MKRFLFLTAALSLLLCLTACGSRTEDSAAAPSQQTEQNQAPVSQIPEEVPALEGEAISVLPAEDADLTEGGSVVYREDGSVTEIALLPIRDVTDFHYFTVDFREEGDQIVFIRGEDLYTADTLSAERPLLLWIPFVETIPNRGVSYVDADGTLCQFTLVESGEDGSILLMETDFETA